MLSFIAGFIDGDGCLVNHHIKIECHSSWKENLEFIGRFLKRSAFIEQYKISYSMKGYVILEVGRKDSRIIKNKIILLNIPILNRKWDKIILK